jgi:hypothetical protein
MMTQSTKPNAIFPDMPRNTPLMKKDGMMEDAWKMYFDQMTLALQTFFKPEGFVIPQNTTSNIALLTDVASYGNIIYNSTVPSFQGNIAGTWKTFTLT